MELKSCKRAYLNKCHFRFKLYLYGIEMGERGEHGSTDEGFKLYLYGIEIVVDLSLNAFDNRSNCTFMELKYS